MTSNARPYEVSHKRNDFANVKTTVGTIINRPKKFNQSNLFFYLFSASEASFYSHTSTP